MNICQAFCSMNRAYGIGQPTPGPSQVGIRKPFPSLAGWTRRVLLRVGAGVGAAGPWREYSPHERWRFSLILACLLAGNAFAAAPAVDYARLPLAFEANLGQFDESIRFLARGPGYRVALTATETVIAVDGRTVRLRLVGANRQPRLTGEQVLPGHANYFLGNDPQAWRTEVPLYRQVRCAQVYPGVDLVQYGNPDRFEHDFVVAPGADPRVIRLAWEGAQAVRLAENGDLVLTVAASELRLEKPVIYQVGDTGRQPVAGRYVFRGRNRIGFAVDRYDRTRPLVIDPVLVYATYLKPTSFVGGDGLQNHGLAITTDAAGNAYIAGVTESASFPATGGAFQPARAGNRDAFVAKLNPTGTALVFATYLGGDANEIQNNQSCGIAVDKDFNVYVVGASSSTNFPTTVGAVQPARAGADDAFIAKLNPTGSALVYATYLGGTGYDYAWAVAVDTNGNAYACGETANTDDFPTTPGAFLPNSVGISGWVAKLNPAGSALVYSTYLSTNDSTFAHSIAVDDTGHAYVAGAFNDSSGQEGFVTTPGAFQTVHNGADAFVLKLNPEGSGLVYSTFLGGVGDEEAHAIALDGAGNAHVAGTTTSTNFPTTVNAVQTNFQSAPFPVEDGFATKLNADGTALVYSTYLGGHAGDTPYGLAVDVAGNAWVTGGTGSTNFPVTPDALQDTFDAVFGAAFVTQLDSSGVLVYSSYLRGTNAMTVTMAYDIAADTNGSAYVTGTAGTDFPTTPGVFQSGGFFGGPFAAKFGAGNGGGGETNEANHDLVVLSIKAPKKVTLKTGAAPKPGKLQIAIQNLGDQTETITDATMLQALVNLEVASLGGCAAPAVALVPPKNGFPITLAPGKKLNIAYTVAIDCANDPLATSKTADHSDYEYSVMLELNALNGATDAHPVNDDCPRPASGADKGCGNKDPVTKQVGADVLTDVVVK